MNGKGTIGNGDRYRLRDLKIEVTQACLLSSIHCSSDASAAGYKEMEAGAATSIVRQAAEMGVAKIAISGGEPLLWPGIEELLELCRSLAMHPTVYTSGIVPDSQKAMDRLRALGVHRVVFSFFSGRPEVHDEVTQTKGSWEQTLAVVQSARNAGLPVEFHFVPMRLNYTCLPELAAHAANLGVRQISVLRLVPQGRARCDKNLLLSDADNLRLREIIEGAKRHCRIRLGSPYSVFHTSDSPNCMAGIDRLTIAPDLRIYPCDAFKRIESMEIARTREFSSLDKWSLSECWLHSAYLRTIREHLRQPFKSPCSDCTYLPDCKSGCPAQKYLTHGELSRVPDPMCLQMGKR